MDHIEHYDEGNAALYERIASYLKRTGRGPTYFCRQAGVYQSALGPLKQGSIKSEYARKLQAHIDKVDPDGRNPINPEAARKLRSYLDDLIAQECDAA